jgi:hypothetical protein
MEYQQDTYNPFFTDQKEPPYDPKDPVASRRFIDYWKKEKDRCMNGFYLADGQVKIPGFLYFHIVYWKIARYVDRRGKRVRIIGSPDFRDIDWDITNDLERCELEGKFYALVGARGFGKSIIAASRAGYQYTFFDNSEAVISAGAESYIKLTTDKIEDGLTNIHPIWKKQRLRNDWKKEVTSGWKDKKTNQPDPNSSNSKILMRNYQGGNNTMAANGTRPGFHLIDEIGTLPNLIGCIKDSDGCWWANSEDNSKPSCIPMFTGTGGDMEVGADAAEIFFTPDGYNILSFENPEAGGKMGRFISVLRALNSYKYPSTLAEYLGIDHPDLQRIEIQVTDEERAKEEWWAPKFEAAKKAGNPKTLVKFKAYWPTKPSESFIVLSSNNYNVEAAKIQKAKLIASETKGTPVWLYNDGEGNIKHTFTDKQPVTEFPVKTQDTDAPVVIYEFPIEDPPWGLYIAGVDPYRHDEAANSDSLGAIYIYKRMHEISGEKYQDMFVASYVARPKTVDEWNEQARLLLRYYNAFALVENDDMTFIRYMQNKGDDYYLSDQPSWLTDIVPNTTVNRPKGIHRSSEKVRNFLRTCLKRYLDDPLHQETDDRGRVVKETLGVSRVLDPMLLEEIVKFNAKDGNYDREVAASLAVALADKMTPIGKVGNQMDDARYKSLFKPREMAVSGGKLFTKKPSTLFAQRKNKLFL